MNKFKPRYQVIHPNVSVLPGFLLQVVLAVHGVADNPTLMYLMWPDMLKTKKTLMSTNIITAYHMLLKKTLSDVIYPNVSVLPGLLLQVVLAVHGVVDHQTTSAKIRQVGYQIKGLSMNFIVFQFSCLWVR